MKVISFADELIAAPIGAVLLGVLEMEQHPHIPWQQPVVPDDARIAQAAGHVSAMSFGDLLEAAFNASSQVGPWNPDGPDQAFEAYLHVEQRRSIAEAVDEVFGEQLRAPIDLDAQEWWVGNPSCIKKRITPAFCDFAKTYGSGEFPWEAVRTVTAPPRQVHQSFVWEQEIPDGVGRWSLPIDAAALEQLPVYTIHSPGDWAKLVKQHPLEATPGQGSWGLPNNQSALSPRHRLYSLANQHASVGSHSHHLVPDWTSVSTEYCGVHLSWGGWITSEGYARLDEDKTVTMVRYWFSDRTFWLSDVFGDPVRLPAPDIRQDDVWENAEDEREVLRRILGR